MMLLVKEWNEKVNLISRKDVQNLLQNHMLPCLGLTKLLLDEKAARSSSTTITVEEGDNDGRSSSSKGGGGGGGKRFRPVIMDVGTGGGFPGLPVAICLPE